jgi:hypothetical protein
LDDRDKNVNARYLLRRHWHDHGEYDGQKNDDAKRNLALLRAKWHVRN